MKQEFTNKPRDMQWLRTGHLRAGNVRMADGKINLAGPITGFLSAIIYGNDDCPDKIEVYPFANPDVGDFCLTFKLDDDGLYRETLPAAEPKVFEVTGVGFDGDDDRTDDRVLWVRASSYAEVDEATRDLREGWVTVLQAQVAEADEGIDFILPRDLDDLRLRLAGFHNVEEAGK